MSTTDALLAVAVAGAGTLLMRLAGAVPVSRRLAEMAWMRQVPLAVLLVLAITSVSGDPLRVPSPATVLGTVVVGVAALRRVRLLLSVPLGCAVYIVVQMVWPAW